VHNDMSINTAIFDQSGSHTSRIYTRGRSVSNRTSNHSRRTAIQCSQ